MFLAKTPSFVRRLLPGMTWRIETTEPIIYLTFDDGPVPTYTDFVLEQLDRWNAKATFFCVGDNVRKHPIQFHKLISAGHAVGNHTFNHMAGWGTDNVKYLKNVRKGAAMIQSDLFRPPYGKIKGPQMGFLRRHYKIIMWDVLSGDYNDRFSARDCIEHVTENVQAGSIVVFHDSKKAFPRLREALPEVLEILTDRGYRFEAITNEALAKADLAKTA